MSTSIRRWSQINKGKGMCEFQRFDKLLEQLIKFLQRKVING